MEIKPSQFDMTNPFASLQQRFNQVETVLRQMPPAQREQLLAEMLPPIPIPRSSPLIEPAVTMVTVQVAEWDGGPPMQQPQPTAIFRPHRIARHIPWQWRLIVAGIRLTRIMRKSARLQMKQFNKLQRRIIRRVLPRRKAMRGAPAR
ncbi:hypothetical protein [Aromatoleum bremense]|uniref:Uncharacterized protein n=1 Tax=Aromatoleum bremense TaxID=76115 RepID=A0ABX1P0L4_9RHOO|nr:hypothetical protein [Aromatoleum bremense]NMG17811.1 hypothetical protein [Aromatoleum bremense]QTQ33200.1 Uncharacterized protein pbN1_32120 [Aromatoleum bremense]